MTNSKKAKFVRSYEDFEQKATKAISDFASDVRLGNFPSSDETYHMADDVVSELQKIDKNDEKQSFSSQNSRNQKLHDEMS